MRILIVAPEQNPLPPKIGASVETCIYQIAKRMAKRHHVFIISRKKTGYPERTQKENMVICRILAESADEYVKKAVDKASQLEKIHGLFDLIQVDNRPAYLPSVRDRFKDRPLSLFLHSATFVTPPRCSTEQADKHLSLADVIIANSEFLKTKLKSLFPQNAHKIRHVLLGVDVRQFRPPSPSQKRKAKQAWGLRGKYVVGYAGRIVPDKGIDVLIKAVHRVRLELPHVCLVIAGGPGNSLYARSLRKLAASLRVPVRFLGYVPRKRMHKLYWAADCFVCPSQIEEAFGLVNAEALATGIPVVASEIGGIPEIVRHRQNGILVSSHQDEGAFAKEILQLAKDKSLAARLGKQARRDITARFRWRQTARRVEKIYLRLLQGKEDDG